MAALEAMNPNKKRVSKSAAPLPSDDIPFIQHIAYIEHRDEIQKYMRDMKVLEKKEFDVLKVIISVQMETLTWQQIFY